MIVLQGTFFDGKRSQGHHVSMIASGQTLKIVGRKVNRSYDARRVRRSLRVDATPRWLYLPGGGACVTSDNDAVDRITHTKRYERILQLWEAQPTLAALAIALVAGMLWLLIDQVLPIAVWKISERVPLEAEASLGRDSLKQLDSYLLRSSRIPLTRQRTLQTEFAAMMRSAAIQKPVRLEFRASPFIGANAFALPAGIIVVTDQLVTMAQRDEEILGVLAHELGHVQYRHLMRRLIQGSAVALVITGVTGDVSSATSLAASVPALILQSSYSRDNEREADAWALALMERVHLDPSHFGTMLSRIQDQEKVRRTGPDFLSSHPVTAERIALAQAAHISASAQAQEPSGGDESGYSGDWKRNCGDSIGLKIRHSIVGLYSITFCGPGGCFKPGTYLPDSAIDGDPQYEVVSTVEIRVRQKSGEFQSYRRCSAAGGFPAENK